jgi:hypothetical protein
MWNKHWIKPKEQWCEANPTYKTPTTYQTKRMQVMWGKNQKLIPNTYRITTPQGKHTQFVINEFHTMTVAPSFTTKY